MTKVLQVTNIAPQATADQMSTLFGFLGAIEECRLYPSDESVLPFTSRVCYIKFADPASVGVAQHITNTVFIDRALIVVPVSDGRIPDEEKAMTIAAPASAVAGLLPTAMPSNVMNTISGSGTNQMINTIDPRLTALGLPQYPPLPATTDAAKIEEIRRTVYVGNLDSSVSVQVNAEQLMSFFNQVGEVKYVRMAGDESQVTRFAFVEFTDQSSIAAALQYNGVMFGGRPLKVNHSNNAIVKPQTKTSEAAQKEIEEAMRRVREAQSLISMAIDPAEEEIALAAAAALKKKKKSRSRSKSKKRSRSRSRKRSRSRRRSRSRGRRSRSRKRSRSKKRSTSRTRHSKKSSRRSRSRSRSKDRHRSSRHKTDSKSESSSRRDEKDRDRKRSKDRGKSKERESKDRGRSKERGKSKDRGSKDRGRSKERAKSRDRGRSKERAKSKDRGSKDRGRSKDRGSKDRGRSKERGSKDRGSREKREKSKDQKEAKKASVEKEMSVEIEGVETESTDVTRNPSVDKVSSKSESPQPLMRSRSKSTTKTKKRSRSRSKSPGRHRKRRSRSRSSNSKRRSRRSRSRSKKRSPRKRSRSRDRKKSRSPKKRASKARSVSPVSPSGSPHRSSSSRHKKSRRRDRSTSRDRDRTGSHRKVSQPPKPTTHLRSDDEGASGSSPVVLSRGRPQTPPEVEEDEELLRNKSRESSVELEEVVPTAYEDKLDEVSSSSGEA